MKLSAAELEKAKRVAFMVSEPIYKGHMREFEVTYDSLLLDGVDGWVDVVLGDQRNAPEGVHHHYTRSAEFESTYGKCRWRSLLS